MKENLLLLCMAYPEISRKYGASVCMAGITEDDEFRRIYPIPFQKFLTFGFHKRHWVSYEIKEKGDYRKESFKIRPETLKHGDEVSYEEIRTICKNHLSSLSELNDMWKQDRTSLGIIKPKVKSVKITEKKANLKALQMSKQKMLDGNVIPLDLLKYDIRYYFNCGNECNTEHKITCLDTEFGQLCRNLTERWGNSPDIIIPKLKQKFHDWMVERDLYFMMGTHSLHPNVWMIISLLYPPKENPQQTLFDF